MKNLMSCIKAIGYRIAVATTFIVLFILDILILPSFSCAANDDPTSVIKRHITIYGSSNLLKTDLESIAKNYHIVITEWWKYEDVAKLKKLNPNIIVLFYRDLNGVLQSYDDWKELAKNPKWFVRDKITDKPLVHKRYGWYLMDLTNPGFRQHLQHYIQKKLEAYTFFDGVFLDDTQAKINPDDFRPEGMTNNTSASFDPQYTSEYRENVSTFLKQLKLDVKNKLIIINSDDKSEFIQHVDGLMYEGFVHGPWQKSDRYSTAVAWQADMQRLSDLNKTNKMILIHSGSEGTGEELNKQFLFCFVSFLLLSNQNTYFYFESSSRRNQLLDFQTYYQDLGKPVGPPIATFEMSHIRKLPLFGLKDWATAGDGAIVFSDNIMQFISQKQKGSYLRRCFDIAGAFFLKISVSAKGVNVSKGDTFWKGFALIGKFYDANKQLVESGIDLAFNDGTYDWKNYTVIYEVPIGTSYYCVDALGFWPSSIGTAWLRDIGMEIIEPTRLTHERMFEHADARINPFNKTDISLVARTAVIIPKK